MERSEQLIRGVPDLYSESLDVVGAVGSSSEVRQVELDLIPAIVESHWHRADERLDPCRALVIARTESTSDVLVIEDL